MVCPLRALSLASPREIRVICGPYSSSDLEPDLDPDFDFDVDFDVSSMPFMVESYPYLPVLFL